MQNEWKQRPLWQENQLVCLTWLEWPVSQEHSVKFIFHAWFLRALWVKSSGHTLRFSRTKRTFPSSRLARKREFHPLRMCNGRRGEGVLIAVRDTFKSSLKDDMLSDSELIFVDISFPNDRKIIVGAFYRPPNAVTKPLYIGYARRSSKFHISGFGYHHDCRF